METARAASGACLAAVDVELAVGLGTFGGQASQQHVGPNARAGVDACTDRDLRPQLPHSLIGVPQPRDVHEGFIAGDGLHAAAPRHQQLVHL